MIQEYQKTEIHSIFKYVKSHFWIKNKDLTLFMYIECHRDKPKKPPFAGGFFGLSIIRFQRILEIFIITEIKSIQMI
ncbi:hypothetical protein P872_17540 [Rhodonellum psychrophilum GCM71 = DSM 17998]|uniref:Uncharacterized protein n=1 Tax=Rhodonellum psychrophilum GCM71 = DSM 17998 TaxID=1123057 RepID=U5BRD7_9BACT|nr:hypothetical protein P872_17540 [Rhodonellum psychrophilum GCM71 = DSM 17998]